ncbi:MAG TPA: four helix bundle protein [Vicinamibacterales bacterium]
MTAEALRARTKKFALDIIRFAKTLPTHPIDRQIAVQLTDAASSVASNYRAVCRARSRADFINKLGITIEEADEAALWLEILAETGIANRLTTGPLWQEADELTRILVRSRETARNKHQSRNPHKSRITTHQSSTIHKSPIANH